jgi:hypothetical protein
MYVARKEGTSNVKKRVLTGKGFPRRVPFRILLEKRLVGKERVHLVVQHSVQGIASG